MQPLGCESLLAVPIRYHGQTLGALWFEHELLHHGWSAEEISFAHTIGDMLALRLSVDQRCIRAFTPPEEDNETTVASVVPSTGPVPGAGDIPPEGHPVAPDIAQQRSSLNSTVGTARLAVRITDTESTTMVELMFGYLEEQAASQGIEYMKIMGEEIVCAAGIDPGAKDHARRIADLALNLQNRCTGLFASLDTPMEFRIGIDTGSVMGTSVGRQQKTYNIWGESASFASKMAESGVPGGIQVSQTAYQRLRANYLFQARSRYYLPNIGETSTYLLTGRI
jgi:hypothetical protein